jgi:hypothetical protein
MSQRHVMDYTDDETLVEALHRPPAVGVWQPRRAFLLLALLPLLAAILGLSLAVGALGVAVRPDAAPVGRTAAARPVPGPHVLEQPPRRRLLLLHWWRLRRGHLRRLLLLCWWRLRWGPCLPLSRRLLLLHRRQRRRCVLGVVVVREARGLGQPLVVRQGHGLLRRAVAVVAVADAVHEQQVLVWLAARPPT